MAKGLSGIEFKECLAKGKIKKFGAAPKLAPKELKTSGEDLDAAFKSFANGNYKWATIQGYYSMFHSARALIYSKGYRERSHYCLIVTLRALFVSEGLLSVGFIEALQNAKVLRENADYENEFSKESARALLDKAKELLNRSWELLDILDELNDGRTRDAVREGRSAVRYGSKGVPVFPRSRKIAAKRK